MGDTCSGLAVMLGEAKHLQLFRWS